MGRGRLEAFGDGVIAITSMPNVETLWLARVHYGAQLKALSS